MVAKHVAVKATLANPIDAVLRIPMSLLVGDDERTIRIQAHAVGGAKSVGDDVSSLAVFSDSQ